MSPTCIGGIGKRVEPVPVDTPAAKGGLEICCGCLEAIRGGVAEGSDDDALRLGEVSLTTSEDFPSLSFESSAR